MQEISWNYLMFTTRGGIRELKVGLDCPLVVPSFLGEQNPEQAVQVLVSRSSRSCHLSTTCCTFASFPAALSAQFASPKFATTDLIWPFTSNAARVMMIIPTQTQTAKKPCKIPQRGGLQKEIKIGGFGWSGFLLVCSYETGTQDIPGKQQIR